MKTYEELERDRISCFRQLELHQFILAELKREENRIASLKEDAEHEVKKWNEKLQQIDKDIREKLLPLYPEGFQRSEYGGN